MRTLINRAIERPIVTGLVAVILVAAGLFSLARLPMELDPRVEIPVVIIVVPYPGASPEDVEAGIAHELEVKLNAVNDVDYIATTCLEGACATAVRFFDNVDINRALQDVRDAVEAAKPEFPPDAEEPQIRDVSFSDIPLVLVSLSGEPDHLRLLQIAEDLRDAIEPAYGVSTVEIYGGLTREIEVRADRNRLQSYGLTLANVITAVRSGHYNLPGGQLDGKGGGKILLRTVGEAPDIERLQDLVVAVFSQAEGKETLLRTIHPGQRTNGNEP